MKIDVFIASNQKEFAYEITYILDSFKNNSIFNKYFNF